MAKLNILSFATVEWVVISFFKLGFIFIYTPITCFCVFRESNIGFQVKYYNTQLDIYLATFLIAQRKKNNHYLGRCHLTLSNVDKNFLIFMARNAGTIKILNSIF